MDKMPVNEGLEKVAAFPFDLQLFAVNLHNEGDIDAGGGSDISVNGAGDESDADVSIDDNIHVGNEKNTADAIVEEPDVVNQGAEEDNAPEAIKKQSPEADRAFAEMRRKAEAAEKAAQQAKVDIQAQRDAEFANRFGKSHGIFTEAQYWAALDREEQAKTEQQRQQMQQKPNQIYQEAISKGYDPEVARLMAEKVQQDLELQDVKQRLANVDQREMERQKRAMHEMAANQIRADHTELSKKYGDLVPPIKELDEETKAMMQRGVPLKAAWLATHEDEVLEFAKKAGANKTMKNVNSKAHLQSERSGSGDFGIEVNLDPDQLKVWRQAFPNESDARLKKRASKYIKRGK